MSVARLQPRDAPMSAAVYYSQQEAIQYLVDECGVSPHIVIHMDVSAHCACRLCVRCSLPDEPGRVVWEGAGDDNELDGAQTHSSACHDRLVVVDISSASH